MIDWTRSYSPEVRVYAVNRETWADAGLVGGTSDAKVSRKRGGLLESATFTVEREVGEAFEEGYHRIVMVASQGSERQREEIATLLCLSASSKVDHGALLVSVEGRSVLYPASVKKLLAGRYAPKGCDGAEYAASLLRECLAAPVSVEGSFTLDVDLVFDLGASHLDAAWELLEAGNFCIQVDGRGTVHILPLPTEPALELTSGTRALLVPGASYPTDYSSIPNVYVADDGGVQVRVVNDDPASPTSTVSRGYEHDEVDKSPKPVNGESLAAYARRRLQELSTVEDAVEYVREYQPGVLPYSMSRAARPDIGMVGDRRIDTQTVELGEGARVSERAVKEVSTWTA